MAHCCALYLWVHTCLLNQQAPLWFDLGISDGWNISSTDSHSPTKVLSLWILKNFPNLLDNLHWNTVMNSFFIINTLPLVRMKLNTKNGPQDRSWGAGVTTEEGPWSQASPTSQKIDTAQLHRAGSGYCSMSPEGRDGGGGDRQWLI